jgi:hypothetical protein
MIFATRCCISTPSEIVKEALSASFFDLLGNSYLYTQLGMVSGTLSPSHGTCLPVHSEQEKRLADRCQV